MKRRGEMSDYINAYIPPQDKARLRVIADLHDSPLSEVIREAFRTALPIMEERYGVTKAPSSGQDG